MSATGCCQCVQACGVGVPAAPLSAPSVNYIQSHVLSERRLLMRMGGAFYSADAHICIRLSSTDSVRLIAEKHLEILLA